jgi:hypothetical protein
LYFSPLLITAFESGLVAAIGSFVRLDQKFELVHFVGKVLNFSLRLALRINYLSQSCVLLIDLLVFSNHDFCILLHLLALEGSFAALLLELRGKRVGSLRLFVQLLFQRDVSLFDELQQGEFVGHSFDIAFQVFNLGWLLIGQGQILHGLKQRQGSQTVVAHFCRRGRGADFPVQNQRAAHNSVSGVLENRGPSRLGLFLLNLVDRAFDA